MPLSPMLSRQILVIRHVLLAQIVLRPVTDLVQQADLDYMDDNVEKLARRKMKSDAMKRAFAINGRHPTS